MNTEEIIKSLNKRDPLAVKELFDNYYPKLFPLTSRYAKSEEQAEEMFQIGFKAIIEELIKTRTLKNIEADAYVKGAFIKSCIAFIKNIRSEYYVSSTVYATEADTKNYDLFENNEWIDFNHIDNALLIKSLQQLVPSQRLVFNLHVVDGYTFEAAAELLESGLETVKSNLEKARYNLQKNIEKNLKGLKT